MSETPISPLRRRMIEDITVRNFVEKTRSDYIRHVRTFTAHFGRGDTPRSMPGIAWKCRTVSGAPRVPVGWSNGSETH
jgi:hypothetical protein